MRGPRRRNRLGAKFEHYSQSGARLAGSGLVAVCKPSAAGVPVPGGPLKGRSWRIGRRSVRRAPVPPLRRLFGRPFQGAPALLRGETCQGDAGLQVRVRLCMPIGPANHAAGRAPKRVAGRQVPGRSRSGLRADCGDGFAGHRPSRLSSGLARGAGYGPGTSEHALPVSDLIARRVPGYCALRVRAFSSRPTPFLEGEVPCVASCVHR